MSDQEVQVFGARESWLERAIAAVRPRFEALGYLLPDVIRVSVGWSLQVSGENATILGVTISRKVTRDDVYQIYVSPMVDDAAYAVGILMHELCHVAVGCDKQHGPDFRTVAEGVGLVGPDGKPGQMTTALPGIVLAAELMTLTATMGDYPHKAVDLTLIKKLAEVGPDGKPVDSPEGEPADPNDYVATPRKIRYHSGAAPQTARLIKCVCECGYTARITRTWLAKGNVRCPDGHELEPQS